MTINSITVNNGGATPVAHTFVPQSRDNNGVVKFRESDGVPLGDKILTLSLKEIPSTGRWKGRLVLAIPRVVEETINGVMVSKIQRTAYADLSVTFDASSTATERDNILALLGNMIVGGEATVDGAFRDLNSPF